MRAEDIVGISFFGLLIPSIGVAISGRRPTLTPRQRALWQGWGLSLICGVLLAFSFANFTLIHISPRAVVEGNIWDIREAFGSEADLTSFRITDATGHAVLIRCWYSGAGLTQGERARVRYVAYNGKLLELDMLTGPFPKWRLQESSGERGWWWWVAGGVVFGFCAYRQLAEISPRQTTAA